MAKGKKSQVTYVPVTIKDVKDHPMASKKLVTTLEKYFKGRWLITLLNMEPAAFKVQKWVGQKAYDDLMVVLKDLIPDDMNYPIFKDK